MENIEGLIGLTIALATPFALVGTVTVLLRAFRMIGPKRKRHHM